MHQPSEGVGPIGAEEGMASSSSRPRFVPLVVDGPALLTASTSEPSGELVHDQHYGRSNRQIQWLPEYHKLGAYLIVLHRRYPKRLDGIAM